MSISKWWVGRFFASLFAILIFLGVPSARAEFSIIPDGSVDELNFEESFNNVSAIAVHPNGTVYLGGDLQFIGGGATLNFAEYTTADGQTTKLGGPGVFGISGNNALYRGYVNVVISDGNGGYYVGGNFKFAKSTSHQRPHLIHINPDGTFDNNFDSSRNLAFEEVYNLLLSSDGTTLFVVSNFGFATLDAATGADTGLAATMAINGSVTDMALSPDGATIYLGGAISDINGDPTYANLVALNATTGAVVASFQPVTPQPVTDLALSSDGSVIYIGGTFTCVGVDCSITREGVAAFSTADGALLDFDPGINGGVVTIELSPDDSTLYAGFNQVATVNYGGLTRIGIAAFDTSATGTVLSFNPMLARTSYDAEVRSIAVSPDGNTVYVAGIFDDSNGGTGDVINNLAAFNASDSSRVTGFNPYPISVYGFTQEAVNSIALSADGTKIFAGGSFQGSEKTYTGPGYLARGVARFFANGNIDPTFLPVLNQGRVYGLALSPDGATVYVGGDFDSLNCGSECIPRSNLAAFPTNATATGTGFNPNLNNTVLAMVLSPDGSTLYVGGAFTTVNGGTTRNHLAAFNTTTGLATSFNPNVDGNVRALQLSSDGSTLYVGGAFTTVNGGTTRNHLAAFSTAATGTVVAGFDPNIDSDVLSLALTSSTVYAGGYFSTVNGGTTRNYLAAFNTSDGIVTSFDPNPDCDVTALNILDSVLYAGGCFSDVNGGVTRNNFASFDMNSTGTVSSFDPDINSDVVSIAFTSSSDKMYVGGYFTEVNGYGAHSLARFSVPVSTFTIDITAAGTGTGLVSTDVGGISFSYPTVSFGTSSGLAANTVVTLTATPNINSTFSGWSGDADCSDGSVTLTADTSCVATFAIKTYTVTVNLLGNGSGSVTSTASGLGLIYPGSTTATSGSVDYGSTVSVTAIASAGQTSVMDSDCNAQGGVHSKTNTETSICTFSSLTANKTLGISLQTISTVGVGGQTVTASGGGGGGGGGISAPTSTQSGAVDNLEALRARIRELQAIVADLIAKLAGRSGGAHPSTLPTSAYRFTRDLRLGVIGDDVKELQKYLNRNGFTITESGPGSPGNETTKFGGLTFAAVVKFQEFYKNEILIPAGVVDGKGTGLVLQFTRNKINPR